MAIASSSACCVRVASLRSVEVGERDARLGAGRHRMHGFLERGFCHLTIAACQLQDTEIRVERALRRITENGFVQPVERAVCVVETRKGVAEQRQRARVPGGHPQHAFRARFGFRILIREQQQRAGLELCVDVVGHRVGSTHVFAVRVLAIADLRVNVAQLQPRHPELRILLERGAVFDNGVRKVFLRGVLFGALDVRCR